MSRYYDKDRLKEQIGTEQVYDLLELWGGEPEYTNDGLISQTICHNLPGEGSRKLYYYENTRLFICYTGCPDAGGFDIFDLCIKVMKNQKDLDWELYNAMNYIATYFGFEGEERLDQEEENLEDWEVFKRHKREPIKQVEDIVLPAYDSIILTRFAHPHIASWEAEGISYDIIKENQIWYYPGNEQIVIPHFDINNRLIGIRGRYLDEERAIRYGKYRPLSIGKTLYTHPLSMNLYNLNNSKEAIREYGVAIIFEGEKSALLYQTLYGKENDISVACCGSSVSNYHIHLLRQVGAREIILAFDRQFQEIGDDEFQRLKNKILHIYKKYGKTIKITAIFDKDMITGYKSSPIDEGIKKFETLVLNRIMF